MTTAHTSDTIVALCTGNLKSALGIIRLSGEISQGIIASLFQGMRPSSWDSHTLHYGAIVDPQSQEVIDEVVVSWYQQPRSYTGEDVVEISCHGSPYILQSVLNLCIQEGARLALPGEFTQRAFLNGRLDLSQAEAVADLIDSESRASHRLALDQMRGGISTEITKLRERLVHFAAMIELELDFSEEDVEFADRAQLGGLIGTIGAIVHDLIHSFSYGNSIKNGVPVAIVGKPNAGKSSLLNAMVREERAIVSDVAGTTRDVIEDVLTIGDIQFRFLDTAGLRETQDEVEAIGVRKALEVVQKAQVLIYLFDRRDTDAKEIVQVISSLAHPGLQLFVVENKMDLLQDPNDDSLQNSISQLLDDLGLDCHVSKISTHEHDSIEQLKISLLNSIHSESAHGDVVVTNVRHLEALKNAQLAQQDVGHGIEVGLTGDLLSLHIHEAIRHLGTITGDIDVDRDILGTIFSSFCIGK